MGNVIKPDWSWRQENSNYKKPLKVSTKASKRAARRLLTKKCYAARRAARVIIGNLTAGTTNRDYANALFSMGKITGGPYGKKTAAAALVRWYESLPPSFSQAHAKPAPRNKRNKDNSFYESREWRELRYKALTTLGRKCQCCGAVPPGVVLHVDHIKPRSKFRELELDLANLQILCADCNLGKSNKDDTDFRS